MIFRSAGNRARKIGERKIYKDLAKLEQWSKMNKFREETKK